MANRSISALNLSNSNCDFNSRASVEKGIISNGIVLDNVVLNEKLKNSQSLISKDIKRPSLAIYRPGMGLLHKHSPKTNGSDEERAPDGEENWSVTLNSGNHDLALAQPESSINKAKPPQVVNSTTEKRNSHRMDKEKNTTQKKYRGKRPDQPKYIPKPKIVAQCTTPEPSEKGDDQSGLIDNRSSLGDYGQADHQNHRQAIDNSLQKDQERQNQKVNVDQHRNFNKTNYTCLVIKQPNCDFKGSQSQQDIVNAANSSNSRVRQSRVPENSRSSDNNHVNRNNLQPNTNTPNTNTNTNNTNTNTKTSVSRDNRNSLKGKSGRKSKKGKDSSNLVENLPVPQREKVPSKPRNEDQSSFNVNVAKESSKPQGVEYTKKNELEINRISNSTPSPEPSLNNVLQLTPSKFNSPKGRGRGRSPNLLAKASENRPIPSEIIIAAGRDSPSSGLDYEMELGGGTRPTLIFESRQKITDWNQEVTDEENSRNAAKVVTSDNVGGGNGNNNIRRYSGAKSSDYPPNRTSNNRKLSESSSGDASLSTSSRSDRPTSDFQQNPPPRFQRNKDNLSTYRTNDLPKTEKGIIKVTWDSIGQSTTPSSGQMQNVQYGRVSEPMQYKTLYNPSQPVPNHHSVPSYHQPIIPRNMMPNNVYPGGIPSYSEQHNLYHHVQQQNQGPSSHPGTAVKPTVQNYPHQYRLHQPASVYLPIPSNTQIPPPPPPQNGLFPQPYSETVIHPQENRSKRIKPIVEKNLCDIGLLERELNTYLSKGLENIDQKALGRCRWKIQLRYENIILADPRFCADKNVENTLWKSTFHQVIEAYRKLKEIHPNRQEEFNKAIINLVEEGTVFYESLLEKQQETFGINFSQYLDNDSIARPIPLDSVKIILISTQKLFICLGDLARYREQATNTSNYGKARSWYVKAQQIAPKNGRPYNQLAILAICSRRKLDAVYYYMRSLAASNPFLSARESLLGLFDEARKKYEVVEKKKVEEKSFSEKSEKLKKGWKNRNNDRQEVWVHPSGIQHSKTEDKDKDKNASSENEISTVELNKRFVLSFLHVHGKLFTKVGMENFTETANQMLQEFKNLLQCSPAPLASVRLLQLLAINMFSVANASAKGGPPMSSAERPLLQEQALQVSLAMMAIVIERSITLLKEHLVSPDYPAQLTSYDLAQLLPTIKVFTDWMSCQRNLWSPPPTLGDLRTSCKGDIWTLYANLLNELKKMKDCGIELKNTKLEGYDLVILPEDVSLACFVPLLGAPQNPYYGQPPLDKERARTWLRIIRILFFGDYLCGISPPYLKFDVQTTSYVSLITSHSEENTESSSPNTTYNSSDEDDTIEDLPEDYDEDVPKSPLDDTSDIGKLWHRQEALKRKKDREERRKAQIQQVLRDHRTKRPIEIEVTPKYLIPDTNCFIDHLLKIDLLLKSKTYNLVVPLIVINELDGLARGEKPNSSSAFHHKPSSPIHNNSHLSPDHQQQRARQVGLAAKDAVTFLEESFSSKDFRLKAVTSKGNIMDSISIRSEDIGEKKGTNDDLILSCCLHYCNNDKASEYMPKDPDGPIHITREVVLLTDDRNLRVKAMTHNVPTRSLDEFLRWAHIR